MKPNRWRTTVRMLGAGIALVLLLGASGEGCDDSSGGDDTDCPKIEAAGQMAVAVGAAVRLPADDLDDDIDRAWKIAQDVADATDSPCVRSRNGIGYKITIAYKKDHTIKVRVMARSKARKNYYRVSESHNGTVNKDGDYSDKAEDTHIDIDDDPDDTVDNILDIIDKIKDRET